MFLYFKQALPTLNECAFSLFKLSHFCSNQYAYNQYAYTKGHFNGSSSSLCCSCHIASVVSCSPLHTLQPCDSMMACYCRCTLYLHFLQAFCQSPLTSTILLQSACLHSLHIQTPLA